MILPRAVFALPFALASLVAHAEWGEFEREFEAERPWVEVAAQLPPAPADADLLEFSVSGVAPHRYFLDRRSIDVGTDKVVRYTVVVQSRGGVKNVFYEGLRCETAETRRYAHAQPDGSWTRASAGSWKPVALRSGLSFHKALFEDVFCPGDIRVKNGLEAVANLERLAR